LVSRRMSHQVAKSLGYPHGGLDPRIA